METESALEEKMYPHIAIIRLYNSRGKVRPPFRIAGYFEIGVYLEDSGTLTVDGKSYPLHAGDVRFIRPGMKISSSQDFSCYSCYFPSGRRTPTTTRTSSALSRRFCTTVRRRWRKSGTSWSFSIPPSPEAS